MKITEIEVEKLIPYANNPRNNDEAVDKVAASIHEFGFKVPVVVDGENVIVCGHTRVKAAKKLGLETVPCVVADDLTDAQIKAFRLADNKVSEFATWDFEKLELELADLPEMEMTAFGFDLQENNDDETPEDFVEDEIPEEVEMISKPGDIWKLGENRLICGDSTDAGVIEKLMDGVKADMVFTDPPYGMNLDTDFSSMQNHLDFAKEKGFTGGKKYEQGKVDEFHPEMIDAVFAIDADEMFLWGADYFAELLPNKNDGSWIVWDKRANGNDDVAEDYSSDKMYGSCFELCWSKKKHKRDIARVKWAGVFGTEQEFDHKRYHPTQKPIKLAGWFLDRYSKEGQVVVDLFGGSGSTLIACEQLSRKCYMCELDARYVDVIVKRWENFTGKKAELLTG
jgi:site-specific DNA-methyltransferase (adenine-specific)